MPKVIHMTIHVPINNYIRDNLQRGVRCTWHHRKICLQFVGRILWKVENEREIEPRDGDKTLCLRLSREQTILSRLTGARLFRNCFIRVLIINRLSVGLVFTLGHFLNPRRNLQAIRQEDCFLFLNISSFSIESQYKASESTSKEHIRMLRQEGQAERYLEMNFLSFPTYYYFHQELSTILKDIYSSTQTKAYIHHSGDDTRCPLLWRS